MKRLAATFIVLAALAGCAPTPVASPTPSDEPPSPTPTPTSDIATEIVMSATGLTIQDGDGDALAQVTYADDPDAAVATLTSAIAGDPQVFPPDPNGGCDQTSTSYVWGVGSALFTLTTTPGAAAPRGQFKVSTAAASVGELAVRTSTGLVVGGDATAVIAGLPADEFEPELGSLIWERSTTVESAQGSFAFGGVAQYDTQGIVTSISAPGTLLSGLC